MKEGSLSVFSGTVAMITTMMGVGTIFMPSAVKNLGCYNFIFVFSLIALISFLTLYMISYVADEYAETHPQNISYYAVTTKYSKVLAAIVDISLIIQGSGSCIVYMASIAKWTFLLFDIKNPNFLQYLSVIIAFSFVVTFVAIQQDLSAFLYVQYLSIISIFYLLCLCIFYSLTLPSTMNGKSIIMENTVQNAYYGISAFVFAISCHQNIVQVYSELQNRTIGKITTISAFCILAGLSIYSLIGFFGYKLSGNEIEQISILEFMFIDSKNFVKRLVDQNRSNIPVKFGSLAFITVLLCAYPMQMHPVRNGFINLISLSRQFRQLINDRKETWRFRITILFCLLVTLITTLTIHLESVVGTILTFVAATAGAATIYIIPAILYLMCKRVMNIMTLIAGSITCSGFALSGYLLYHLFKTPVSSD